MDNDELVCVTDARGVNTLVRKSLVLAMAEERIDRVEAMETRAAAWGGAPSDDDRKQGLIVLAEAQGLLESAGAWTGDQPTVHDSGLSRFTQPGWAEQELAARAQANADARAVRTAHLARMAETALMIDELGEDDPDVTPSKVDNSQVEPPERVNIKREQDAAGTLWLVTGRGEAKRYATLEVAEREARRRVGRA